MTLLHIGSVLFPYQERILACPQDTVQYSCYVTPAVISITWSLLCVDQQRAPYTISVVERNDRNELYTCTHESDDEVTYSLTVTGVTSSNNESSSNISISVLASHFSIIGLKSLRIDCEDSNYTYLDISGKKHTIIAKVAEVMS